MHQFQEYLNSDSQKTFTEFKMVSSSNVYHAGYMTLDKSLRTSDCELVTKYSYASFLAQLKNYVKDNAIPTEHTAHWASIHLRLLAPF